MSPDKYNGNTQQPDDHGKMTRRKFIRRAGAVVGGVVTAWTLGTQVIPWAIQKANDAGTAIGNAIPTPEPTDTPEPPAPTWWDNPISVEAVTPDNGNFRWTTPADSLAWIEWTSTDPKHVPFTLIIHVETLNQDTNEELTTNNNDTVAVSIYKPDRSPSSSWHDLVQHKKGDLVQRFGATTEIGFIVETSNSDIVPNKNGLYYFDTIVSTNEAVVDIS